MRFLTIAIKKTKKVKNEEISSTVASIIFNWKIGTVLIQNRIDLFHTEYQLHEKFY
jgi:hypothetical protein